MIKNIFSVICLSVALYYPSLATAKMNVVSTLPSFANIAESVGGDEVKVTSLTKGNQDPHFVDAKPDLVLYLNKADLVIRAGLGLEDGWLPPLVTGARNGKIQTGADGDFDVSSVIELKEVPRGAIDRSQGDVHPGGNPHFMLDPRNAVVVARTIADKLSKLVPDKASYFKARADSYTADLLKRIASWSLALNPLKGLSIVTYHKSWVYFSNWAGLAEVAYVEPKPGIPPSPDHIVKLINLMKQKKAKLILIESYYPAGTAEEVAHQVGGKVLVLPTEVLGTKAATNYFAIFDEIVRSLKAAQ